MRKIILLQLLLETLLTLVCYGKLINMKVLLIGHWNYTSYLIYKKFSVSQKEYFMRFDGKLIRIIPPWGESLSGNKL